MGQGDPDGRHQGRVNEPQDYDALMKAGAEAIGTVIADAAEKLLLSLNKRLGHAQAAE
jgi:methylmalonyl-CoA mutase